MIDYDDNIWILLSKNGSVVPQAVICSIPTIGIAIFLSFLDETWPSARKDLGIDDITESQIWNAMTAVIAILLAFRTRQALGRFWEGTSLLHQMRGEWFDAASCLVTFSRDAKVNKNKVEAVNEFRHTLVRLMSLMHGSALDEISGNDEDRYEVLDIHGLDTKTLKFLKDCKDKYEFNRVEALQHMIQVLVTHNHHTGVLTIPPPILSRIYQTLSRGLVNLLNARKIKDTMFPFPYAQVIRILLLIHMVFTPILMTQIVASKVFATLLSFCPIFGMYCLNFIAGELEMPFGSDENDLPLKHFQNEMNETLLMLIHDFADHLPHTSPVAVRSFTSLANYARASQVKQRGAAHSDSKSFLRPDFFEEMERDDSTGQLSLSGLEEKQKEAKDGPPAAAKAAEPAPAPAPPPVPAPAPAAPAAAPAAASAAPAPSTAVASVGPSVAALSVAETTQQIDQLAKDNPALRAQVPNTAIREPRQGKLLGHCLCEGDPGSAETQFELIPQVPSTAEGAVAVGLAGFNAEFSDVCIQLLRRTETQVQELKINTDIMKVFNSTFPKALREHTQIVTNFSESILKAMQTHMDQMAKQGAAGGQQPMQPL